MKEKNKKQLDHTLKHLRTYKAPKRLWDGIEYELEKEEANQELQTGIESLRQYKAPNAIWGEIETQLDYQEETKPVKRKFLIWKRVAMAAAVTGLVFFGIHWLTSEEPETIVYSYTKETIDVHMLETDWDENEAINKVVMRYCMQEENISDRPELKTLKDELEELNKAKASLIMAMENYGKDAEIINQLKTIENDRSNILQQLIDRM